jgi:hypothetical protein
MSTQEGARGARGKSGYCNGSAQAARGAARP